MMTDRYQPLHARPLVQIEAPRLVSVVAFPVEQDSNISEKDRTKSENLCSVEDVENFIRRCYRHYNENLPRLPQDDKQVLYNVFTTQQSIKNKRVLCTLQKHTNFFSIFFISDDNSVSGRFNWNAIPDELCDKFLDRAAFKTHIRIEKADQNEKNYGHSLRETFNCGVDGVNGFSVSDVYAELFSSLVSDQGAVIWTPFKSFSDGFNRILIRDISLRPARLGRLVRRLAEIDMYVTLGSQNFYAAQEQLSYFNTQEESIKNILEGERDVAPNSDRSLYKNLVEISKSVAAKVSQTGYSFRAAIAYSDLVWQRVHELREQRVEGWTRIGYFLERTFRPCVRTYESALRYQVSISEGIQEATSLLGTGLSLQLEEEAVARSEQSTNILEQLKNMGEISSKVLHQQQERERNQQDFRHKIEIIALIPTFVEGDSGWWAVAFCGWK